MIVHDIEGIDYGLLKKDYIRYYNILLLQKKLHKAKAKANDRLSMPGL